jgi:hypothetical protein
VRNRIPFGYTPFGGKILVKLNVKISNKQALELVKKYSGLCTWDNGKYGMAIDGVIEHSSIEAFHKDLQLAKIDANIEKLLDAKAKMLDSAITNIDSPNFDLI